MAVGDFLTATTVLSGLSGVHRCHFAQVNNVVVITNGHDANKYYDTRSGTAGDLGLVAPTGAPTHSVVGAGNVDGAVTYRVRWFNSIRGAISNASPVLSVTATNDEIQITRPGSPPSGVDYWFVERTTSGGRVYFPLNRTATTPNGTAIGTTTYNDNLADATIRQRYAIPDRQGIPNPFRFCFSNQGRIFMGGGRVHRVTATMTNGSASVTGGSGFTSFMVGQDLSVPGDTDTVTYPISAYGSATALTLASNYAGTTGSKTIQIAGRRDVGAWSEAAQPEAYGAAAVSTISNLSNEVQLGDDGQPLTGGVGVGVSGVVWAKETKLFMQSYTIGPGLDSDGRIIELPTRRGAAGPLCIQFIDGFVYGMDQFGIWRMAPGGLPMDISASIANDWRACQIYGNSGDNWHIGWNPNDKTITFWITDQTDDYPRLGYVWSIPKERWVNMRRVAVGQTRALTLPDAFGMLRENTLSQAGANFDAYMWTHGIGTSAGLHPDNTPTTATVTSGTSTTITATGASWQTSGEKSLDGVEIVKASTNGLRERRIITGNTSDTATVNGAWFQDPVATDRLYLGPICCVYRTGRLSLGAPERKYKSVELWAWIRYQGSASSVNCRIYCDGSITADSDKAFSLNEDGVTITASSSTVTLDPTVAVYRYRVPFGLWKTDVQIELFSDDAGEPWSVLDLKLNGVMDDNWDAAGT